MKMLDSGFTLLVNALRSTIVTARDSAAVLNNFIRGIARDKLCLMLLGLFSVIYLPHAFILVEDLGLISAYEVDPGSHLSALDAVLKTYNMHAGYHSKFYGWTFFALNFVLITPIRYFLIFIGRDTTVAVYLSVRLILFAIGLASTAIFYGLLREIFRNRILPTLGTILYITSPVGFTYFYFIHPETLGAAFIFLAVLFLLKFSESASSARFYYPALISLVLAALSKQIFFILSLPLFICFFNNYCVLNDITYASLAVSRIFLKTLVASASIALFLLAVIHPYSLLEFWMFLQYQSVLGGFISGEHTLTSKAAFFKWMAVLFDVPLVVAFVLTCPFVLVVSTVYYYQSKHSKYFMSAVNTLAIIAICSIIIATNRLFPYRMYLQPIYPFMIISLLSIVCYVSKEKGRVARTMFHVGFLYAYSFILFASLYDIYPHLLKRLNYQSSVAYLSFDYINKNLERGTRIAHDHFVGIPKAFSQTSCHYWSGCGTDSIEEFNPTYVIFNTKYNINETNHGPTERLKKYVQDHNMALVGTLVEGQPVGAPLVVSIYKK